MKKLKQQLNEEASQLQAYRDQLEATKNKTVHNLIKDHESMSYHQIENTKKRLQKTLSTIQNIDLRLSAF